MVHLQTYLYTLRFLGHTFNKSIRVQPGFYRFHILYSFCKSHLCFLIFLLNLPILLYYLILWTFMLLLGDNLIKAAFGWGFLIITYFIIYLCSSSKWGFSLYKLLRPSNVTTQTHVLRNFNPTFLVKSFYYTQRPWSLKNSFLCAWKFDWT